MRSDLGYAGAKARMLFKPDRSKASDPKRFLTQLPTLVRTTVQIATFKAGNERKTIHRCCQTNENSHQIAGAA